MVATAMWKIVMIEPLKACHDVTIKGIINIYIMTPVLIYLSYLCIIYVKQSNLTFLALYMT